MDLRGGPQAPIRACVVAAMLALGLLGCGDEDDTRQVSTALREALAYLPPDPPLALIASTDLERGPLARLDREAAGSRAWRRLQQRLKSDIEGELDYETVIRPQLGAPVAVASGPGDNEEYSALVVRRPAKLQEDLQSAVRRGDLRSLGTYKGAPLVKGPDAPGEDEGFVYSALHRRVLIGADSKAQLERAIDRSAGDRSMAARALPDGLEEPAGDVVLDARGDGRELLDSLDAKDAREARSIPWVRSLGDFDATGAVSGSAIELDFELHTDGTELAEQHLPLSPERQDLRYPQGSGVLLAALAEPVRLYRFGESILRATDRKTFREYRAGLDALDSAVGLDVHRDLLARIRAAAVAVQNGGAASLVARLADGSGQEFSDALDLGALVVQGLLEEEIKDAQVFENRDGTWAIRRGGRTIGGYAVRGDTLVGAIRRRPPAPAAGVDAGSAALALRVDTEWAARSTEPDDTFTRDDLDFLSRLGVLSLTLENTTEVLRGQARFAFAP